VVRTQCLHSSIARRKLTDTRDDLVDNFSTHQDEVEKLLSEGVKKLGLNGR
jgi:hypothetical protein